MALTTSHCDAQVVRCHIEAHVRATDLVVRCHIEAHARATDLVVVIVGWCRPLVRGPGPARGGVTPGVVRGV